MRSLPQRLIAKLDNQSLLAAGGGAAHADAMATDRFETIPAWRIARLRAALADAERRGALPSDDDGSDLDHAALRRRFALGRARREAAAAANARTTRKGRRFPATKQRLIWRAILAHRPAGWRSGDKAPRGSISQAHREAAAACRAAGLSAPRYRTIQVLWHRGVPPPGDAVRDQASAGDRCGPSRQT